MELHPAWEADRDVFEMESKYPDMADLFMDYTTEDLDYVIEGYVGKTKECQAIEKQFASIKKRFFQNGRGDFLNVSLSDVHGSPEMKEISRQLEKLTGFRTVEIIVRNSAMVNMYTMPAAMILRSGEGLPQLPVQHGKRYYDEKHCYFCYVCIYQQMIAELEPAELTAILLHEVGHNFDHTLSAWIFEWIVWGQAIVMGGPLTVLLNFVRTEYRYVLDWIQKLFDYTAIIPLIKNGSLNIRRYMNMALGPIGRVSTIADMLLYSVDNPALMVLAGFRFQSEPFADSYATSLGYGPELISSFDKMEKRNIITNCGPLPEFWTGFGSGAIALIYMFIDEHPESQTRCKLILEAMRDVANDPQMPKSMKKAAMDEYNRTKKAYDAYLQADPDKRNACILRFTRDLREKIFGGKMDFRSWIYNAVNPVRATNGH